MVDVHVRDEMRECDLGCKIAYPLRRLFTLIAEFPASLVGWLNSKAADTCLFHL